MSKPRRHPGDVERVRRTKVTRWLARHAANEAEAAVRHARNSQDRFDVGRATGRAEVVAELARLFATGSET